MTESLDDLKRMAIAKHGKENAYRLASGRLDRKATWREVNAHPLLTNEQIAEHRDWQKGLREKFPWLPSNFGGEM